MTSGKVDLCAHVILLLLQVAGSLACAKRGWVNSDVNKIECEICGATLGFTSSASSINFGKFNGYL